MYVKHKFENVIDPLVFLVIFRNFCSEVYLKPQRSRFCMPAGISVVSKVRVARSRGAFTPPALLEIVEFFLILIEIFFV